MAKDIKAKPTTYAGVTFKSRLEARWAVMMDYNQIVDSWNYEPQGYTLPTVGWSYTPDFIIKVGPLDFYLEVKPIAPNDDYVAVLSKFAVKLSAPLVIGFGGFFKEVPKVTNLTTLVGPHEKTVTQAEVTKAGVGVNTSPLFPGNQEPLEVASRFRFDITDGTERPSFRRGKPGTVQRHMSRWATKERLASRKKRRSFRKKKGQ